MSTTPPPAPIASLAGNEVLSNDHRHAVEFTPKAGAVAAGLVKYAIIAVSLVLTIGPMYVLLVTSFKSPAEVSVQNMWALPRVLGLDAWGRAWTALSPAFTRTLVLAITTAAISSLLGALNGFVLARVRFRGAEAIFAGILFGMFIPYQAVMVPLRAVVSTIGLPPGIATLIFVHTVYGIPICTLIFRSYYVNTISMSLIESASVDGASVFGTFRHIILPLSPPIFVVAIIWQFTMVWNDFLFAIFLTNTRNGPIMLALSALAGAQSPDYAQSMAGALIASMPPLVVYIVLGRYFVGGLMAGAVKG